MVEAGPGQGKLGTCISRTPVGGSPMVKVASGARAPGTDEDLVVRTIGRGVVACVARGNGCVQECMAGEPPGQGRAWVGSVASTWATAWTNAPGLGELDRCCRLKERGKEFS